MVFSSAYFLLLFLPFVLLLYFLVTKKYKNLVLLAASLYFYAYGEKFLVLIMIFSTLVDYKCGIMIEEGKKKLGLRISLFANLLTLGIFKYFNFAIDNFKSLIDSVGIQTNAFDSVIEIALPLGISFYVFQTMSYTIDVYRGNVKASRNLLEFATYVTMFPQLVAGPIVRYIDIQKEIVKREVTLVSFSKGLERFILGLAKKMILANTFASVADSIFTESNGDFSTMNAWIGILAYTFQIYFDFSAYSDMAIGLGKMFGFNFLENFNYPYISKSIKEFWRRWHISLSSWFKDYLYISLGGNRKGKYRTYLNLFIVFFITGLWHGAAWNFVIWGLFHGLFIVIERVGFDKILDKLWNPIQHIYTLFIVVVGWVLFRAEDFNHAMIYLKTMFVPTEGVHASNDFISYFNYNSEVALIFILGIIFSFPIYPYLEKKLTNPMLLPFRYIFVMVLLFVCIVYIAAGSYNPFIYFRF
ncbi:membrane-bound O-acyltransferase family protein [Hanstruepera neustonica]|uniref:Membrane-bound O-acyltransferase family protein n=1 Tax=Hanstruepera neustonica TaxID=1445657 RepID=A0A2K1E058_9FLAO|nr:MBOAT family O-acyltransferase [Hanstruepera neustonica]PNQ73659.1 membrane-bound O-acyltransferase family protein [Hanstruepera neustonica]